MVLFHFIRNIKEQMMKDKISAIFAISFLYFIIELFGITCPIKYLTGISCAGCGMSRAWLSLLHGNLRLAFHYHPLFLLVIPMIIFFLLKDRFSSKVKKLLITFFACIFLITYFIRLIFLPNDIICARPSDGIIAKIIFLCTNN